VGISEACGDEEKKDEILFVDRWPVAIFSIPRYVHR